MTLTQEITLDIYEPPYFEYVNAKQADNISRVLIITLTANGDPLKPNAESEVAVFRALKPDGTYVLNPATIGEDGKVTVKLTDQTLAKPGKVEADVSIVHGDEVLSSATMYIQVTRAPVSGKQITSTNEFLVMTEAAAEAKDAAAAANKAAKNADDATGRANAAAQLLEGMTVTVHDVEPGGEATAALTREGDHYDLDLGLVKGKDGPVQRVNGKTGDVETRDFVFDISIPASGWINGSQTVVDVRFIDGDNLDWDVDVKGACIPWDGITITEGQMVARADIVPTEDMTWKVTRREVRRDG